MTYMRGSRKDYDDWARLGNAGWNYRDVLPYFIRSEDNQQVNSMDYGYHGVGGPLTVTQFPYHPPLSFALLEAGKELGSYDDGSLENGNSLCKDHMKNRQKEFSKSSRRRLDYFYFILLNLLFIIIQPMFKI
ncbi:Glucose dehydrogenase [acceptor] [Ooceraea biroi]|uniref:Glucose dehydrogenase [acceptor] n=1 Tax=Ooceraea biroi TaxID=2015173 RepID=A0A026WPP0_OOCBI|nr:Glucose dehydrogenase [acceptor] [Ooceraea biroi]